MDFVFGNQEYYEKIIELQEKLRKSEEERLQMEIKLNEMLQTARKREQMQLRKLHSQYKKFIDEDKLRQQRNEMILDILNRVEDRTAHLEQKTERFQNFRRQFQQYLLHMRENDTKPFPNIHPEAVPEAILRKNLTALGENIPEKLIEPSYQSRAKLNAELMEKYLKSHYQTSTNIPLQRTPFTMTSGSLNRLPENSHNLSTEYLPMKAYVDVNTKTSKEIENSLKQSTSALENLTGNYYDYGDFNRKCDESQRFLPHGPNATAVKLNSQIFSNSQRTPMSNDKYSIDTMPTDKYQSKIENIPQFLVTDETNDHLYNAEPVDVKQKLPSWNEVYDKIKAHINDNRKEQSQGLTSLQYPSDTFSNNLINKQSGIITDDSISTSRVPERVITGQEKQNEGLMSYPININYLMNSNSDSRIQDTGCPPKPNDVLVVQVNENNRVNGLKDSLGESLNIEAGKVLLKEKQHLEENEKIDGQELQKDNEESNHLDKEFFHDRKSNEEPLQSFIPNSVEQKFQNPSVNVHAGRKEEITSNDEYKKAQENVDNETESILNREKEINIKELEPENDVGPWGDENDLISKENCYENENPTEYKSNKEKEVAPTEDVKPSVEFEKGIQECDENNQMVNKNDEINQHDLEKLSLKGNENYEPVKCDENMEIISEQDHFDQQVQQLDGNDEQVHNYDISQCQFDDNLRYDENGQPIPQYDENGRHIQHYDENGSLIQQYAEGDQMIQDETNQSIQQCNENQQYSENSEPIQLYEENNQVNQPYDENSELVPNYDENGHPIYEYDNGNMAQPMRQYDENGQLIQQYDENGQILYYNDGNSAEYSHYQNQQYSDECYEQNDANEEIKNTIPPEEKGSYEDEEREVDKLKVDGDGESEVKEIENA